MVQGTEGTTARSTTRGKRSAKGREKKEQVKTIAVGIIRLYQLILSPLLPPACRFYPSCSHYGLQAIEIHGVLRGSCLTAGRILRCQPLSRGGYDPVP